MNTIDKALDSLGLGFTEPKKARDELGQKEFLELMTTQLKNQDPFKPMESGEFLTQIAQFTQASGIQDLNDSFGQLSSSLTSNQALQASSMVGRKVMVPSSTGLLSTDGLSGNIEVPGSTSNLNLKIYDMGGQLVQQLSLGAQAAGQAAFHWDGSAASGGRVPNGQYRIQAEALVDGKNVAADTYVVADVESVTLGGPGQGLNLNLTSLGRMDFSLVKEIL